MRNIQEIGKAHGMPQGVIDSVSAGMGHNSNEPKDVGGVAGKRLQAFIERIERLESEKASLTEDIKEIYSELKAVGFDTKTVRKIVGLRKINEEKRQEQQQLLELYASAIGMQGVLL